MHDVLVNFHGLGTPRRELEAGEAPYWITVDAYEAILDMAASGDFGPRTRFGFTFDDGNLSDADIGAPALEKRRFRAHFFPLSSRLDTAGSLTTEDVRRLIDAGHVVGSHGADHVDWRTLDDDGAHRELISARKTLEAATRTPIDTAAIPFGAYDRRTLARLKAAGYRTVYTSDGGPAARHAWLKPRTSVRADMTEADFADLLSGHEGPPRRLRRMAAMIKKRLV